MEMPRVAFGDDGCQHDFSPKVVEIPAVAV